MAVSIVSRSLISPTKMMSGSSLNEARSASEKFSASAPIERWLIMLLSSLNTYSIGSSIVTMCDLFVWFMKFIMLASVVVLPLPVGPVTRMMPRVVSVQIFSITLGKFRSFMVGIFVGVTRKTAEIPFICKNIFTRKQYSSFSLYEKSISFLSINSSNLAPKSSFAIATASLGSKFSSLSGMISPLNLP